MKWALVADFQFDSQPGNSVVSPTGYSSRLNDMVECWTWITGACRDAGVEAIGVLGDVFNSRTSIEIPVLDAVCRAFEDVRHDFDLYVIPGNHDSYQRHPRINSVQAFRGFATVIDEPTVIHNGFGFVPWYDDPASLRDGVNKVLDGGATVLLSHALVEGVNRINKGLPLAYLQPSRFQHVYLGDVHDHLTVEGTNVTYVGSPLQIDYRCAGQPRGFLTLDDQSPADFVYHENTVSPRFHVVKAPSSVDDISAGDFVRLQLPADTDPVAAKALVEEFRAQPIRLDNRVALLEAAAAPRLAVRTGQAQGEVLERYVRLKRPEAGDEEVQRLVAIGTGLLEGAKV